MTETPKSPGAPKSPEFKQAATWYRSLGLAPIPLQPRSKAPLESNWEKFSRELPTEEQVANWWEKRPNANVGLVTGRASGVFVLDVDGDHGRKSLEERPIPATPRSRTGSGGEHIFLRYPDGVEEIPNRVGFLPGLDVRGGRGQVVAPPSVHPSGGLYEWVVYPGEVEFADPPAWLTEYLAGGTPGSRGQTKVATLPDGTPAWLHAIWHGAVEGARNDTMARIAGHYVAMLGESEALGICLAINQVRFSPPLEEEEVERVVMSVSSAERRKKLADDYLGEDSGETREGIPPSERGQVALEAVSRHLGVRIEKAYKYRTDPPSYELLVQGVRVAVKTIRILLDQRELQHRIADETGTVTKWVGKDKWPQVKQALLDACEEWEIEEGTERGQLKSWLSAYLADHPPQDQARAALNEAAPFWRDGALHLNLTGLRTWLKWRLEERVSTLDLSTLLRRHGAETKRVGARLGRGKSVRALNYWVIPSELTQDAVEVPESSPELVE